MEFPRGSAAKDFSSEVLENIAWTPYISSSDANNETNPVRISGLTIDNSNDFFSINVTATNELDSRTGGFKYDMYVFIVNPSANGSTHDTNGWQYYALHRRLDGQGVDTHARLGVSDLQTNSFVDANEDAYLIKEQFIDATVTETIFGGPFRFDTFSLPQGLWQAVVILADRSTVDFQSPSTWAAWETAPFILGTPWKVETGTSGDGTCQY